MCVKPRTKRTGMGTHRMKINNTEYRLIKFFLKIKTKKIYKKLGKNKYKENAKQIKLQTHIECKLV